MILLFLYLISLDLISLEKTKGLIHPALFLSRVLIKNYPWDGTCPGHYFKLLGLVLEIKSQLVKFFFFFFLILIFLKKFEEEDQTEFQTFIHRLIAALKSCPGDKSENSEDVDSTLNGALIVLRFFFFYFLFLIKKNLTIFMFISFLIFKKFSFSN